MQPFSPTLAMQAMLEQEALFHKWLDKQAAKSTEKFADNQQLDDRDMLILMLKYQTNHIAHLEVETPQKIDTAVYELRKEISQGFEVELPRKIDAAVNGLRDEMMERFEQVERQFENVNQRFEQVDKRFEQVDKRFEQMERQFENVNQRFEQVDKRFEQVDKRFEQVERQFENVNQRFEQVDKRFEQMDKRLERVETDIKGLLMAINAQTKAMNAQTWKIVGSLSLLGAAAAAVRYFLP